MSVRTRSQWSVRHRIAATIVGTGLLGSLIFTSVQASPMTPYQDGYIWIAAACYGEPDSQRLDLACIEDKCHALYKSDLDKYDQCVEGGKDGIEVFLPPLATPTAQPVE